MTIYIFWLYLESLWCTQKRKVSFCHPFLRIKWKKDTSFHRAFLVTTGLSKYIFNIFYISALPNTYLTFHSAILRLWCRRWYTLLMLLFELLDSRVECLQPRRNGWLIYMLTKTHVITQKTWASKRACKAFSSSSILKWGLTTSSTSLLMISNPSASVAELETKLFIGWLILLGPTDRTCEKTLNGACRNKV